MAFGFGKKKIESLEREVLSNPTPKNMVVLVERLIAVGEDEKALDVARKAVGKFPDSEQCVLIYQNLKKIQFQSEIQELNRAVRTNPDAAHYERLAQLYFDDLNNRNRALEVAMEGLSQFPRS